eukprot:scaffold1001_cov188-Ochromonas_danica.AAC.5
MMVLVVGLYGSMQWLLLTCSLYVTLLLSLLNCSWLATVEGSSTMEDYPWYFHNKSWQDAFIVRFKDHPLRKGIDLKWLRFLRNKRISFVGDSLTRYQYLSLAWFLSSGQWLEDPGLPSMIREKEFGSWDGFLRSTNKRMGCHEIVDAYRNDATKRSCRENRYFYHYELNLTITLNNFFPPNPILLSRDFPTLREFSANCMGQPNLLSFNPEANQSYADAHDFITHKLVPFQPDYLIFNHGFWSHHLVSQSSYLPRLQAAVSKATKYAIWKATTTELNRGAQLEDEGFRKQLSSLGFLLFDTFALTKHLNNTKEAYFDHYHFGHLSIYRELNIALLQFLLDIHNSTTY